MIKSEDCVVWVNPDDKVVRVTGAEVSLLLAYKPKEVHLG
jgi:hypothetical protein